MRASLIYFLCAIVFVTAGCATLPGHYMSLHEQRTLSFEEIFPRIANEKVIFVGEGHDTAEDHLVQFEVVRGLNEGGKNVVIALEMFPSEAQPVLNRWIGGEISEHDFRMSYYSAWNRMAMC